MSLGIFQNAFIHHTIVRIKFLQYDLMGSRLQCLINTRGGIDELCGSRLTPPQCSTIFPAVPDPNPQEDDAEFREISKRAVDGPSRASRPSKTFRQTPIVFRVLSGNPESRLSLPLGLGMIKGWLRTWDAPELLAVQDRRILLRRPKNSPCSVNPEFESRTDF